MAGRVLVRALPLLLVQYYCAVCSADGCDFPASWWGEWFLQGARGPVRINRTHLSGRGRCIEGHDSKFLLAEASCVRCLGISAKHANVLQYKETPCSHFTSHAAVCAEFAGDASLYSLFRLNGSAEECPLQGPLRFKYNQGSGDCANPESHLESCTEPSQLLLRFQACTSVLGSESREEQLTCLASWKEGSVRYLVGRLVHAAAKTDADRLRCFAYEHIAADGGWLVAQSGDATCDALSGATEGSRTLRLWPPAATGAGHACSWPTWFSLATWQPLQAGSAPLRVLAPDVLLLGTTRLRCLKPLPELGDPPESRFHVQATYECTIKQRCLGLLQKAAHVVELRLGDCDQPAKPLTLVQHQEQQQAPGGGGGGGSCGPLLGRLFLLPPTPPAGAGALLLPAQGCSGRPVLSSGCGYHQDQLQLLLGCGSDIHRFECHGSWEENGTRLLVASALASRRHYCIAVSAQRVQFAESPPACVRNLPWPWVSFNLTHTDDCGADDSAATAAHWPTSVLLLLLLPLHLAPSWVLS
ncbi:uncharacterized protein LOC144111158 [Amblyomma americanum]